MKRKTLIIEFENEKGHKTFLILRNYPEKTEKLLDKLLMFFKNLDRKKRKVANKHYELITVDGKLYSCRCPKNNRLN